MKTTRTPQTCVETAANRPGSKTNSRRCWCLAALTSLATFSAAAQTAEFRAGQVRVTVPLNSTNSTVITNLVTITNVVTPVTFDVADLPPGAAAVLTDTNGNAVTSATADTNLWLTLNTTNIAQGLHTFSLNASGGATNTVLFVLQAAHIWNGANGALNLSNAWSAAGSWLGGSVPGAANDVIFSDIDAQTNVVNGIAGTNSTIDVNTTIASLRFTQTGLTNAIATNEDLAPRFHTIRINPGLTLNITGTNGLSLMRDYVDDIQDLDAMNVRILGGAGSRLVLSNAAANFSILVGNQAQPSLNLSNLEHMVTYVSRVGLGEYQLFPNYRNYNDANNFGDNPRRFINNFFMARTNIVTALWKDPQNYTNEMSRTYALSYQNSEVSGVGSSVNAFFYLGQSNAFFLDSVCLIRANHATGNGGSVRFNPVFPNATALFRSTNGGRMANFTVSDDGGTNEASSNVKATIDFASGNGLVDILVDKLYISRDRTLIVSNQTPNVQGDLFIGRGVVDANQVFLGYQEHDGKTNWTDLFGAQPYLNYCQGRLFITNGGTFRVNGTLTLGYTADTNPENAAQQYQTYGQVTVYSNSTLAAHTVVADGGLNFTSISQPRRNELTVNQGGTLIISNTIGAAPGLKLDTLNIGGGTLTLQNVDPSRTNVLTRNLQNPGSSPATIRILTLTGVSSFPAQLPLISYEVAAPFLVADVSPLGPSFKAYILDNQANKTIDVYITTNAPNNLVWVGNLSSEWDTTTKNWVTAVGSLQTNFALGDSVTFNDSTTVNNIAINTSLVPGQTGTGVLVNNSVRNYVFTGSGTIAGTSLLVKQGNGSLAIDTTKQGPVLVSAGTVSGSGSVGVVTVASNANFNFSGFVNGGLTSTGAVTIGSGGLVFGAVTLAGGTLSNSGDISNTLPALQILGTVHITNTAPGDMYLGGGAWNLAFGSTIANEGVINNLAGRLNIAPAAAPFNGGTVYGTGDLTDPDGGLIGIDGRVAVNPTGVLSPGSNALNSIGTMTVGARLDLNNIQGGGLGQLLIELDFNNLTQTNDIVKADKWNNITGLLTITNINPGAGSLASGHVLRIFENVNGITFPNTIDVNGTYPVMSPIVPGPGLQWNLRDFRAFGTVGVTNSPLVWNGVPNGNWDYISSNWKLGNSYADLQGAVFDDSASGTTTIQLTNPVAPAGYAITTNIVSGTTNLFTNGPAMSPGIIVSNVALDYTIFGTGKISGMTGLYKVGSGTLTILTTNDFTGSTIIAGGTIAVSNMNALGLNGSGGINNEIFFDGGTLRYMGTNANFVRSPFFQGGGATIEVLSPTNELTLNVAAVGPGGLTKIGPGTLVLSQNADNYAGGTLLSAGTLRLTAAGLGTAGLTVANNTVLHLTNGFTFTNAVNFSGPVATIRMHNTNISSGAWSGNTLVSVIGTNLGQLVLNESFAGFGGTLSLTSSSNSVRFNNSTNSNPCTGSTTATFDLGSGGGWLANLNGAGLTYDLGALSGGPNTVLFGSTTNMGSPASTYSIGANGSNTTFSGRITNGVGTVSITKVGSGTLALGGSNTYSGPTTVSAGTLLINNSTGSGTGSGAVAVNGGTLGGNGTIAGAVTVGGSGTLSPGTSIGTLAINNSLSLSGTTVIEVSRSGAVLSSDKVVGLTSVSFGGTLVVSNVGPQGLEGGDSFQLFNTGGSGNFSGITPPLAGTQSWSFNPATGVLTVLDSRPRLTFVQTGGNLQFSWAGSFKLQSQTNGINVGLTTTWFDYPGGGSSPVNVPINPANGTVFFRLVSTP